MILKIHQALHGYADGHRQLACSISLPTKDARLILVMSDVSGPGVASLGLPYLTGYPLMESGLYALAKTWPAPEMQRPGCVWTHTLLVGFADLAMLVSPSIIAELFQRPVTKAPLDAYAVDLVVEPQEPRAGRLFSSKASSWFARLASAVYEHPDVQVWARRTEGRDVDEAVLRLWDQQWPRLKRSFRFCTLTSRDRSPEGMPFDLQLSPASESSSHLRFSSTLEGFEATTKSAGPWLDDLLHDAQFPHDSTLRPFLRKLGADMLGGREAMQSFCSLHAALELSSLDGISDAVQRVQTSPMFSASELAKTLVAQAALEDLPSVDDLALDFVIDNLALLPEASLRKHQEALAQVLWERDPRRLIALGGDARVEVREAVRAGALSITNASAVRQLEQVSDLPVPLLEILPIVAEEPLFWADSQLPPLTAARAGIDISKAEVLQAMILGLREYGPVQLTLQAVGAVVVLETLQSLLNSSNCDDQIRHWLRYGCADTNAIAQFLAKASSPSRKFLSLIAETVEPDDIPNDVGADPWYLALQALVDVEGSLPIELQVFGFRRALGRRSLSVENLLRLTFESLHLTAERNALPEGMWRLLESSLTWAPFGQEWDHAIRLRRATARKCNDMQLDAEGMAHLVSSDVLFLHLLEEICELWGGPKYLRSVNDALLELNAQRNAHRSHLLDSFLKHRATL